jgi:DNA repair exonuclease SbcCD ATPase subunit/DNA repair exonuclease SbcCD nuclease subunit
MKRIAHISDTHIRNLKYHEEYRHVFKQIYDSLKQESPDYIVHTGDLAHTKTQLSPEYFEVASNFLRSLADIAPTIMILGNHDGNLKNGDRQDAVTPIIEALQHPNFTLLKNSGEYSPEPGLTFNVLSVFDRDNWQRPSNDKSINIAMYHGSIMGSELNSEYAMDHGEDDITIFESFDYAMLGDIHRTQYLDPDKKVWYAGSTVQQNFGESKLKGYLMWNIHDKDKHTVEKRLFQSPRPFITVRLNRDGTLPKEIVPKGSRLRLVCEHNLPIAKLKRACDYAKVKWDCFSVSFVNNYSGPHSTVKVATGKAINMRDEKNQEKFLREYMENKEISSDVRERVVELSREYLKKISVDDVSRNVVWDLKKMEWNYLFNYGKGNSIDFSKLNGLVGIFGKNYSGKSSIIDAALFGLFNDTSKGERKNVHIINQNQEKALCKLEIAVGDDLYKISRSIERTKSSAKTDLDFTKVSLGVHSESKNGETRNRTDEEIQKKFGTMSDFLMTSLAAQNDSFGFINEGSTKRKEILAKFLDLQVFDQMHKLAKADSSELRGVIKHLNSAESEKKLKRAQGELSEILEDIQIQKDSCDKHRARLEILVKEQDMINNQVSAASQREIDIESLKSQKSKTEKALSRASSKKLDLEQRVEVMSAQIEDMAFELTSMALNADSAAIKLEAVEMHKKDIGIQKKKVEKTDRQSKALQSKIDLLHDHEYDPDCEYCSNNEFVKQAEQAKMDIVSLAQNLEDYMDRLALMEKSLKDYDVDSLESCVREHKETDKRHRNLLNESKFEKLELENAISSIEINTNKLSNIEADILYYNENIEAYENLVSLRRDLVAINKTVDIKKGEIKKCDDKVLEYMSEKGSATRTIEECKENITKIKEAERDYIAYDIFVQSTHPNGISYEVIKSMLPVINGEIQKILASIVDFKVFFADEGSKLEIYLQHPKYDPRPLSMGSGAEKTIASMAVRLALVSVSSLPKSQVFILDEPATALDADHMEGFTRLLQMIKTQFKTVLLITHLESLKDVVDTTIEIDKVDGYAQVNL